MVEPTDEDLMLRVQRGDSEAFEVLYQHWRTPLYAFVLRLVREPAAADDIYQETFLRVLREASRYGADRPLSTWLFTIAHHLALDYLRVCRPREPVSQALAGGGWPAEGPLEQVRQRQLEAAAWSYLAELPPEQRAVVLLRVVHGCSQAETARVTGTAVGTVKSRLHYALTKLRERLGQ